MKQWKRIGEPDVVKVGWRTLVVKQFEQPNGKVAEYTTVGKIGEHNAAVIAVTKDNKIVVAEQFRPGPEMVLQELPGGGIEQGEDPQSAVMRELREETGYSGDSVEFLGIARRDAYTNATAHYYIARSCEHVSEQELDETEFITIHEITIDELLTNATSGKMTDSTAVLMAYNQLMKIQADIL